MPQKISFSEAVKLLETTKEVNPDFNYWFFSGKGHLLELVESMDRCKGVLLGVRLEDKTDYQALLKVYNEKIGKIRGAEGTFYMSDQSKRKIKTRLKVFTFEELLTAIDNFSKDEWRMKNNAKYGVPWFFHSDDRITMFLSLGGGQEVKSTKDKAIQKLENLSKLKK